MGGELLVGVLAAVLRLRDETAPGIAQAKASLGGLATATDGVATATVNAGTRMSAAAALIAGAFAAAGIGDAMHRVAEEASHINDQAQKMGIGVEAVQRLGFAASQAGSSLDAVGTAITFMGKNLTNDTKLAKDALERLGLSAQQLKQMKPEDAFLAIAEAIRKVPDPMQQSADAMAIFGRGGAQLLPAIREGMERVGAQAPVMSAALVKAGDDVGDSWNQMQLKWRNLEAQALLPLMDTFTKHVPQSMQVAAAAFLTFLPSIQNLALAFFLLGGASGVGALITAVGGFLSGVGAALLTFFTTTLPAAFVSVITFLGPQGLIAVAVIALGLVWYKWGDDIKRIVSQVYAAVKEWLVDKFQSLVQSVKDKIGTVTKAFGDMYDKVFGHSYVPDMIKGIQGEFGKLQSVMVDPTRSATNMVTDLFSNMAQKATDAIGGLIGKIPGIGGALSQMFSSMGGLGGILGKIPGLGSMFGGGAAAGVGSIFGGGAGMMAGPYGALAQIGIDLASKGIGALVNHFRGGEEALVVNPQRDAFMSQFQVGQFASLSRNDALIKTLEAAGLGGDNAAALMRALNSADTLQEFNIAKQRIESSLRNPGFTGGTSGGGANAQGASSLTISLTVQGNVYGTQTEEFKQTISKTFLDALEQGGETGTRFRSIHDQLIPAGA